MVDESLQLLVDAHRQVRAKVSIAVTGGLLAHIREHRESFLAVFAEAISDGIVEPLATSYHEVCPFLIPPRYLRRQVELDLAIKYQLLGVRPVAFWPGNLAWTPVMPGILSDLGLKTVIVDEKHMREAHQTQLWQWLSKDSMQMDSLLIR